jgi:hypothetical protein
MAAVRPSMRGNGVNRRNSTGAPQAGLHPEPDLRPATAIRPIVTATLATSDGRFTSKPVKLIEF